MTTGQVGDGVLSPGLEAIAAVADDRVRAETGEDLTAAGEAQRRVAEAASAAIAAGAALSAVAEAEHTGQIRARRALGADMLRQVTRATKRKRDADGEYEQAIRRAGRLGLSHREIAVAGDVSHGTVRAILSRATPSPQDGEPTAATNSGGNVDGEAS